MPFDRSLDHNHRQYGLSKPVWLKMEASGSEPLRMFKVEQIRSRQEQRLVPVTDAWNEAKKNLQDAIAVAETREREFRAVSEDVQRRLDALELVISMAREIEDEMPEERLLNSAGNQPMLMSPEPPNEERKAIEGAEKSVEIRTAAPASQPAGGLISRSSRPLFGSQPHSRYGKLSILQ